MTRRRRSIAHARFWLITAILCLAWLFVDALFAAMRGDPAIVIFDILIGCIWWRNFWRDYDFIKDERARLAKLKELE